MSRVEIHTDHVIVDGTEPAQDLADIGAKLWEQIQPEPPKPGPATGFTAERRAADSVRPIGHGARTNPPAPVTAKEDT